MKGLFVRPYVALVGAYFRWAKVPVSRLAGRFSPKSEDPLPTFASLDAYAQWMATNLRWRNDPLGGVLDKFPDLRNMVWQLRQRGVAEEDCDGLAYFSAAVVRQFADALRDICIVTLVLDPTTLPLQQAAHVLCIFRTAGKWRVISNTELYPRRYQTFLTALVENPYCRGRKIRFMEVRDATLKRRPAPED